MQQSSRNVLGKIIAIQITITLAVLLVGDVLLWLFFPIKLHNEVTVEQNLPGVKSQIVYATNQYGFRSLSMRKQKTPADTIRILCLGASTTDQANQNTEDTWCALLEKELNEEYSRGKFRFETASYGRGGWKAIDLYAWARINIKRFKPDIVITLMGINDLAWNGGSEYSYASLNDALQKRGAGTSESLGAIKHVCKEYSQICRRGVLAMRRLELYRNKNAGKVLEWHSENLPALRKKYQQRRQVVQVTRVPDPIVEFNDAMEGLLSLLQKAGTEVFVLGQPVIWKERMTPTEAAALWFHVNTPSGPVRPSTEWLLTEMRRYNNRQKGLAARYGATYIDLDSVIPKTLEYYFDDCHYTDAGSRLVASVVFPAISKQLSSLIQK